MKTAAEYKTNNNFIDENHECLLDDLDQLDKFLNLDWELGAFISKANGYIVALENHFLHEETLLRGAGFADLETHILQHREIALNMRQEISAIGSHETAIEFMQKTRSRILHHELIYDQEYWPVFDELPGHDKPLIPWSEELETGHADMDKQHQALTKYINRFHYIYFDSASRQRACSELRALYAYSKLHFGEEENSLGPEIDSHHKAQHQHLLNDLALLIKEVSDGQYKLGNISSHLKYWFLNHLRFSDIPAFRKTR